MEGEILQNCSKLPSQRCQRCIDSDCSAEKWSAGRGKSREKHRMHPRLLCADLCEYYERRHTMSKEYCDSRQSAGLLRCTVLGNKHKQPVSSDVLSPQLDGPNASSYNQCLACKYPLQRPVCTRSHSRDAPFAEPAR